MLSIQSVASIASPCSTDGSSPVPGTFLADNISNRITALGINIEQFSSQFETAGHTGIALFRATIGLGLTDLAQEEQLMQSLYSLGDDLVLDKLSR